MRKFSAATTIILLGFLYPLTVFGQDEGAEGWPKEITIPQGKVIIYQPQSEDLVGNILAGAIQAGNGRNDRFWPRLCKKTIL